MFLGVQQEQNNFHLINVTIFTTIKNCSYRAQRCHHLYLISELICHVSFDEKYYDTSFISICECFFACCFSEP